MEQTPRPSTTPSRGSAPGSGRQQDRQTNANPERVNGIVPGRRGLRRVGGDVLFAEVSAKQRIGIKELLERSCSRRRFWISRPLRMSRPRAGYRIRLDKAGAGGHRAGPGRHPEPGIISCAARSTAGPALFDDRAKSGRGAAGLPAEVQGFNGVPTPGRIIVLEDERKAKQIAMMRQQKVREAGMARISRVTWRSLPAVRDGAVKELKMVLKADVHGSIEALAKALSELGPRTSRSR